MTPTENMEALGLVDSSDSVVLAVFAIESEENITHEEAEQFTEIVEILLSGDFEVTSTVDTIVDGQSGWEMEFEGKVGDVKGKGFILTFYRGNDMFMVMWVSKSRHKEKMLPVYEKVSNSISFGGSAGGATAEPTAAPTLVDLPTPSDLEEIEYESYSLEGVRFNYPSGWRWSKSELIVGAGAMWEDPTYSAMLFGMVTVWPEVLEEEEMEEYAIEFGDDMVKMLMDKYETVVSHKETEVAGDWALEMAINGRISGRKYVGYITKCFSASYPVQHCVLCGGNRLGRVWWNIQ